jgi:site-specific recombinase XerD
MSASATAASIWRPPTRAQYSTATDLIRRGVNRERVQKALGHADPRSTDHYVQLADRDTIEIFRDREK